jgi:hypothetical protein
MAVRELRLQASRWRKASRHRVGCFHVLAMAVAKGGAGLALHSTCISGGRSTRGAAVCTCLFKAGSTPEQRSELLGVWVR